MAQWVLEQYYPVLRREEQKSVWVESVTETNLMSLMEELTERFPEQKLFSLPRLGEVRRIELGYRGGDEIAAPFQALLDALEQGGFRYELVAEIAQTQKDKSGDWGLGLDGQVGLQGDGGAAQRADLGGDLLCGLGAAGVMDGDVMALSGEFKRHGAAKALGGAGHECGHRLYPQASSSRR